MNLQSRLDKFQKAELLDIVDVLGGSMSMRLKKSQMVSELSRYIHKEPGRWLSHLMERDIRLLRDLVHAGPERVQYRDFAYYPSIVELSGIVESDDSDDHYHKVWISREIYDIVSQEIDSVITDVEKSGQYELEQVALGYLNLYGIIPTSVFLDFLFDWPVTKKKKGDNPILNFVHRSPVVKLCRYEDANGDNMASPCIENVEEMFDMMKEFKQKKKLRQFTREQILEAGAGAPYFTVWMNSPEGRQLDAVYRSAGYSGFDLVKAEHDTWMEAQYTALSNPALFDPLYDAPKASTFPDSTWEKMCMAVCDYADSVPKWCLQGRSAGESDQCLCDRKAWIEQEETPSGDAGDNYPSWSMPDPTVSEGYGGISSDFPIGFAIPHVAPDDPCPCGSGLRYCRCHGKYLS